MCGFDSLLNTLEFLAIGSNKMMRFTRDTLFRAVPVACALLAFPVIDVEAGSVRIDEPGEIATKTIALSQLGKLDWAQFTPTTTRRKGGEPSLIGDATDLGGIPKRREHEDFPAAFQLRVDGKASASSAYMMTDWAASEVGDGFRFTVPAAEENQRLRIYLGTYECRGKLTVALSGGAQESRTVVLPTPDPGNEGNQWGFVEISFSGAGETLTVDWTIESLSAKSGGVKLAAAALAESFSSSDTTTPPAEIVFARDIQPILQRRCIDCHGPDKAKSNIRVDQRATLIRGGDSGLPAIVPGNPKQSHILDLIEGTNPDETMPPKGESPNAKEIALLEQWIAGGANWPGQMNEVVKVTTDFWSFQPVKRPDVPKISDQHSTAGDREKPGRGNLNSENRSRNTPSNPIDAFLAARLNEAGLKANAPADARSLIRRASVVLTGLPPTAERVKAFVAAHAADADQAYAALVDELMASPHFGERWAQHWLDVIRWAESNGSEANLYRKNAWVYRDYVTRAFNEDKPYDQFVREQIAGDTFGSGDAMGFLVSGPHVPAATVGREPAAIRQARADRMDEIMQTIGASLMGVTWNCARCHNHKFDPISIKDYYALTGVFQDVEFGSRFPEYGADHPRKKRGQELWSAIAEQRRELRETGGWEENWGAYRELHFKPVTTKAVRIQFKMANVGLDELEVLGPDSQDGSLARSSRGVKLTGFPEKGADGRNPLDRVNDGEYGTMAWRARVDKNAEQKPWVQFNFKQPEKINRLRLSANREYFYDTDYLDKKPYLPRYEFDVQILKSNGEWQPWVGTWAVNKKLMEKHPMRRESLDEIQRLIGLLAEEGPRPSFVGRLIEPAVTRVLHRGSPEDPRDEVIPAGPEILGGDLNLAADSPGPKRRAAFARWISSPENPLTARVMANRIWHHVFGSGIVATTSDFGKAGARPSHPELLEWLTVEFVAPTQSEVAPWSMKGLIRLLVMSDAFQRSSLPSEAGMKDDPGSTLLWRYSPRRVEAEVIRDGILQASGKLDPTIGGRGYRIHNEKKTYAQWEVVDNHGPETRRRMLYQERMRRVDDKMFTAFDFPDCGQVRGRRPVSTTPLQALNLMNSDFVVEQAKFIAERAKRETQVGDESAAVLRAFELLLARRPDAGELDAAVRIAGRQGLDVVCRGLMNANEFAFLP